MPQIKIGISSFFALGVLIFSISVVSSKAQAWGDLGHSIVGAIAEERMEPETRAFVAGVLGIEPMALTATWADSVRDDHRFNHNPNEYDQAIKDADDNNFSDYHFVDIPTGSTYDTKVVKDVKDALGGISGAVAILKAPLNRFPQASRLLALRYLVHLIGDLHQPLHVGNGYDIGGNFCSVKWQNQPAPTNLHSVWDGPMITEWGKTLVDSSNPKSKAPQYYPNYLAAIETLRKDKFNQSKPSDVSIAAIKGWLQESVTLRESTIYPDSASSLQGVESTEKYRHRAYCMWLSDKKKNIFGDTSAKTRADIPPDAIPVLDDAYIRQNVPIIEDRLIVAGVRLAAVLDDIAQAADKANSLDSGAVQSTLQSLQALFHNPINTVQISAMIGQVTAAFVSFFK